MSINIGIVIGTNNPAYKDCAKVRIPAIHGIPLSNTQFNKIMTDYAEYLNSSYVKINGQNSSDVNNYKSENFNFKNPTANYKNSKIVNDNDIPWYPICYPFGNNIGPKLFDIVYVIDNSYVIGWTSQTFCPTIKK